MTTDPQAPLTEGELAAQLRCTLEALRFDLRPQLTFGDHFNQAVVDGINRLDGLCAVFWSRYLATARAAGDGGAGDGWPSEVFICKTVGGGVTAFSEQPVTLDGKQRFGKRYIRADVPHLATPTEAGATRAAESPATPFSNSDSELTLESDPQAATPDALEREVAVARELARLHFDRREWWGACTKAERTAWLVEKYWPQWRNDAASIIALLAPSTTGVGTKP